jgi:hypothetical protein
MKLGSTAPRVSQVGGFQRRFFDAGASTVELNDLKGDPGETKNIAAEQPDTVKVLAAPGRIEARATLGHPSNEGQDGASLGLSNKQCSTVESGGVKPQKPKSKPLRDNEYSLDQVSCLHLVGPQRIHIWPGSGSPGKLRHRTSEGLHFKNDASQWTERFPVCGGADGAKPDQP